MPEYLFFNPETNEIISIFQKINEPHCFEKNGIKWQRVWTNPQMSVDTKIDPRSQSQFRDKLANKKETVGSLWDRSKELSLKREQKEGKDTIKEKYYENYSKTRRGKKHPKAIQEGY